MVNFLSSVHSTESELIMNLGYLYPSLDTDVTVKIG